MQLVLLAAGHGRRFGGLKQLAPVGPKGEALMDYTAEAAEASGFDGVVLVIREEIRAEVADHVRRRWPGRLAVELVAQAPVPGTAQAVLSARPAVSAGFAVANADDLYGDEALSALVSRFALSASQADGHPHVLAPHVLAGYRLERTVLTSAAVTRGLCEVDQVGELRRIVEHSVQRQDDGTFQARPLGTEGPALRLSGRERVSMNLWAFHHRLFDRLAEALDRFDPARSSRPELLLPDVVSALVTAGEDRVEVVGTSARCIGVTHQEDLALVREELAGVVRAGEPLTSPSS